MEEPKKDKEPSLEDYPVLKEYKDMFGKLLGFPLKRVIHFSIDLMLGASPISKNPYRMIMPTLKELQMQLEELSNKGYIHLSVSPGFPSSFCQEKRWNTKVVY